MSFLSKISNLRKSVPVAAPIQKPEKEIKNKNEEYSILPKNYVREEDPAVRRLKEMRRRELLKNGELSKKAKSQSKPNSQRKKGDTDEGTLTDTRFKKKIRNPSTVSKVNPLPRRSEPIKKLSFEELMKQAENNAQRKETEKVTSPPHNTMSWRSKDNDSHRSTGSKVGLKKRADRNGRTSALPDMRDTKTVRNKRLPEPVKIRAVGSGLAQPNEKIRRQLELRKRQSRPRAREEEDESDLDDFIEDDTAEMYDGRASRHGADYDRDEIWALFNRGKRRSDVIYDDYEDDDMEANEMEILEEEEMAGRMARLEDKREEEWLKKHEQEKKRRKRMKG